MAISFTRYVDITSGVGSGTVIGNRNLGGRLFTINPLLPTQSFIEFGSALEVGAYFGTSSEEYLRAQFYFSWVSKNITQPQQISFARWTETAQAPMIFGLPLAKIGTTLADFTAITTGSFALTMSGVTNNITSLNFSAEGSFSAIATTFQNAITSFTGIQWTGTTVTYANGAFNLVGGDDTVDAVISVGPAGTGHDISQLMGWVAPTPGEVWPLAPIWSNGNLAETITDTLNLSVTASNNFGSFLFQPAFDQTQVVEASTWNNGFNVDFIYCAPLPVYADANTYYNALLNLAGTALTYSPTLSPQPYPEMPPMIMLAATDYTKSNSVQNYMFQQFNLPPSVTTDTDANYFDGNLINYYGQTQTGGQKISFYQRGFMSGSGISPNPTFMNIYANEIWLKDAIGAAIMTLLIAVSQVSANPQGAAQILTIIQSVINQALNNGTISVGNVLTPAQILYITGITNDPNAWRQVQNIGYWVDCMIQPIPDTSPVQYQAAYILVYKKDDVVNRVAGTHVLI